MSLFTSTSLRPRLCVRVFASASLKRYSQFCLSWHERRRVEWKSCPYKGGPVDGRNKGKPPGMWQIHQKKPPPFEQKTFTRRVPHTEEVRKGVGLAFLSQSLAVSGLGFVRE